MQSASGPAFDLPAHAVAVNMVECRSYPQLCLLGPVPPRTPGRPDAQVPTDLDAGLSRYGRIPHLYFYETGGRDNAAFGLLDIEIAVQRAPSGRTWLELYCIGDGYQSGRGSCGADPLMIELRVGPRVLAQVGWLFPDVLSGHMDPMTFATEIDLSAEAFEAIDSVSLPTARATSHIAFD